MTVPLSMLALITGGIFLIAGLNLAALSLPPHRVPSSSESKKSPMRPWSFVRSDVRLWAPLLVFWLSNHGSGDLAVVEPFMVHDWHAPAFFYGLMGALGAALKT